MVNMNKRIPLLIILGLVVLTAILVILNYERLVGAVSKKPTGTDISQVFEIPITRDETHDMDNVVIGDAIYYTEKGRLYAHSLDNQPLWDLKMPDDVALYYQPDRLLVVEESVGNLYLLNSSGQLQASHLGLGRIEKAELVETGQVVVVLKQSKSIKVFDEQLKQQAEMDVPEGTILNFHVNSEYNRLTALLLQDTEGSLRTSVVLYNLQGEALQVINRPDIAINTYSYRDEILVVMPDGVIIYKELLTRPVAHIKMSNVKSTHLDDKRIYLETGSLVAADGQGELELTAYSMADREIEFHNKLTAKYDKIVTQGSQILTLAKNNLELQTADSGQFLTKTYPVPIRKGALLPDSQIVLIFSDRITLNQLTH